MHNSHGHRRIDTLTALIQLVKELENFMRAEGADRARRGYAEASCTYVACANMVASLRGTDRAQEGEAVREIYALAQLVDKWRTKATKAFMRLEPITGCLGKLDHQMIAQECFDECADELEAVLAKERL